MLLVHPRFVALVTESYWTKILGPVKKEVIKAGRGPFPTKGLVVTVNCTGLLDSTKKKFWSTKDPGEKPFEFTIGRGMVIKGFDLGVASMRLGEHSRVTLPPDYAYGDQPIPSSGIPGQATLVFEIELVAMKKPNERQAKK